MSGRSDGGSRRTQPVQGPPRQELLSWADGVTAAVSCGDACHGVRWTRAGGLELLDHGEADEVLLALGSPEPACYRVRRSWDAGQLFRRTAWLMERRQLAPLPEPIRRVRAVDSCRALTRVLTEAMRDSAVVVAKHRVLRRDVTVFVVASGARPFARAAVVEGRPTVEVGVSLDWLGRVWLRTLELADGALVLDADDAGTPTEVASDLASRLPVRRRAAPRAESDAGVA